MRTKQTTPSRASQRMIELAMENQTANEKLHTLESIGQTVARELGKKKPFAKQWVKAVFDRWAGWNGFEFDKSFVSPSVKRKIDYYQKGGITGKESLPYHALKKAGVPLRTRKGGYFVTVTCPNRRLETGKILAEMWKSGLSGREIAKRRGSSEATVRVQICEYRKRFPELFPYR